MRKIAYGIFVFILIFFKVHFCNWQNDLDLSDIFPEYKNNKNIDYQIIYASRSFPRNQKSRYPRDVENEQDTIYYVLQATPEPLTLRLNKNSEIISPLFKFTKRNSEETENIKAFPELSKCLYQGKVVSDPGSGVALSICNGLNGVIRTSNQDFLITPIEKYMHGRTKRSTRILHDHLQMHLLIKRPVVTYHSDVTESEPNQEIFETEEFEFQSNGSENDVKVPDILTIELALFFDESFYKSQVKRLKFYQNVDKDILKFAFTAANAVQLLLNDPSFVNVPFKIVLQKVEIFKKQPKDYLTTPDATKYLEQFKKWQSKANTKHTTYNDTHWDFAFMLTGIDIVDGPQKGVIGIAPVGGMCLPYYSCALIEAGHLGRIYTMIHEMGHTFGMHHDGKNNTCDSDRYLMSPSAGLGKVTWSSCSRSAMKKFILSKRSKCLKDTSVQKAELDHNVGGLPGERYNADQQCKYDLGQKYKWSKAGPGFRYNICEALLCSDGVIALPIHPALEGTECETGKWCRSGRCINKNKS